MLFFLDYLRIILNLLLLLLLLLLLFTCKGFLGEKKLFKLFTFTYKSIFSSHINIDLKRSHKCFDNFYIMFIKTYSFNNFYIKYGKKKLKVILFSKG